MYARQIVESATILLIFTNHSGLSVNHSFLYPNLSEVRCGKHAQLLRTLLASAGIEHAGAYKNGLMVTMVTQFIINGCVA